jgi:hypothetical protein
MHANMQCRSGQSMNPNVMLMRPMHDAFNTSGPAPARNVRTEVSWSTSRPALHAHRSTRCTHAPPDSSAAVAAGGVSAAAWTAGTPCLPACLSASACPETRPWAAGRGPQAPATAAAGNPACRASVFY